MMAAWQRNGAIMRRVLLDYRATPLAMDRERIESGGTLRAWNRLVNQLQKLHLELRETPEGRAGITAVVHDPNPTVRGWAAAHSLFWGEAIARDELDAQAASKGWVSLMPSTHSGEFDRGRLNMVWQPR